MASPRKSFQNKLRPSKTGIRASDEKLIPREQKDFTGGVYNDLATTPKNGLLYLKNAIPMSDGVVSRTGSTLFYDLINLIIEFDGIQHTQIIASKSGTTVIVSDNGACNFSQDDIGKYFRGSDGIWDVITDVNTASGTVLTVERNSNYSVCLTCAIRDEMFCMEWCSQARRWIVQLGSQIYLCAWNFATIQRVYFIGTSNQVISESPTKVGFRYGQPILFNSNGMYGINISKALPYYYKLNTMGPQQRSPDTMYSSTNVYGRRYLCTYSILDVAGQNRDSAGNIKPITRLTPNARIEHESSPNITQDTAVMDDSGKVVGSELIDYTEMWTATPVASSYTNSSSLIAASTYATIYDLIHDNGLVVGDKFLIDGTDTGDGVLSATKNSTLAPRDSFTVMAVTNIVYAGLFDFGIAVPVTPSDYATVSDLISANYAAIVATRISTPDFGHIKTTDNSDCADGSLAKIAKDEGPLAAGVTYQVGLMIVEYSPATSATNRLTLFAPPDPHWLYHSIWATQDVGVNGIAANNNSERYFFVKDIPVTKSFVIYSDPTSKNKLIAQSGSFSYDDVGSSLLLESAVDGYLSYRITGVIDSKTIITVDRNSGSTDISTPIAAGIGCAKTARASNPYAGYVTITSGSHFTADDVGKILFWDDGSWDIIIRLVDATNVQILNNSGLVRNSAQGIGWVPADRVFNDSIPDTTLATRAGYLLPHRFFTPMPNCDLGVVVPGFVVTARSNSDMLYYCQTVYPQLVGCFHEGLQYDETDSNICALSQFSNYVVAYGSSSPGWLWSLTATEIVSDQSTNAVGESITTLTTRIPINGKFGIIGNSIAKDENGNDIFLTTEKELLTFDGTKLSANLLSERIMNRVSKLQNTMAARYDTFNGYIVEGTEKAVN